MTTTKWDSMEAFETDLATFSEIEVDTRKHHNDIPVPPAISQYYARIGANVNSSIFDPPQNLDEDVTYVISGRGRGRMSTIYKPGGVPQQNNDSETDEIKRKLRQVSGMGFSNELIEQNAKVRLGEFAPKSQTPERQPPLQLLKSSNSNSSLNSRMQSPAKSACSTSSFAHSLKLTQSPTSLSSSYASSRSSSPACIVEEEVETKENSQREAQPPPPLSVMRSQAKKKVKEEEIAVKPPAVKTEAKERSINTPNMNDYWWRGTTRNGNSSSSSSSDETNSWRKKDNKSPNRFFGVQNNWSNRPQTTQLDINSEVEFPKLKMK